MFASQPSATTPLQSARPGCVHVSMWQVPPLHEVVVPVGIGQITPHPPQCVSDSSDVSQPGIAASQSPQRALHACSHVPLAHVAVAFGKGPHVAPHAPQ